MKKISLILLVIITWISYPFHIVRAREIAKSLGNKKRILIIPQLSRIGDIICSTPVFFNIKKVYPESHIAVLISSKAVGIITNNPRIDEIIIFEDYTFWQLIKKIRRENLNYSINLSATSTNTCLAVWSNIANRIKTVVETPPITEKLTDWMSNHRLLYKNHTYLPRHHINLLSFIEINNPEDKKEIFVSVEAENRAEKWRKQFPSELKIIGLSITAGNKIKELGDDKFEILAKRLLEREGLAICCIGSRADDLRIDNFTKKINNSRCFKVTDFSLEELPSLMKKFSLYIAVDTGPIYIAHTLGIPLIDIIGPVDPNEQPPQDAKSIRILPRNNIQPSSFVFKRRLSDEQIKKALEETDINDIYDAVLRILS